jgi:hypothetical protein
MLLDDEAAHAAGFRHLRIVDHVDRPGRRFGAIWPHMRMDVKSANERRVGQPLIY